MNALTIIGAPSSAGGRQTGQELAPDAFRRAGLMQRLSEQGLDAIDGGDLPLVAYRPDAGRPQSQNLPLVAAVARELGDRVGEALAAGRLPVVLGGDCSIALGVLAGVVQHHTSVGLVYFDADLDLNTPETTHTGILDGMVLAHALGHGAPELTEIGPRRPLLAEGNVLLFGFDVDSGWIDPPEIERLEHSTMLRFPLSEVRPDPARLARRALDRIEERSQAIVVHFDIDVTNSPAGDVEHPRGLDPAAAFEALEVFVASPSCVAITLTEFNAERDPDQSIATELANGLAAALGRRIEGAA